MDSSNAEKAWRDYQAAAYDTGLGFSPQGWTLVRQGFNAGRASRDAEVAALTGVIDSSARTYEELESEHTAALTALGEARARYGDLEVQLAEAQAVIEKVREHATGSANIGQPAPHDGFEEGLDHGAAIEAEAIRKGAPHV